MSDSLALKIPDEGPLLADAADARDLLGQLWGTGADTVAVPVGRFAPEFFDLSTRVAGDIAQKFVDYRVRLAVVGDVSGYEERSSAFRDWVRESNRGDHVWFVADDATLEARLSD